MPRKLEGAGRILDWEALEKAPNTHGAFSFLKSAAEIVSIRRDDTPTLPDARKKEPRLPRAPLSPRLCRLAQDAHSLGESVLYQMLWARGNPETDETRLVCMGWKTMHQFSRLTDKSCKRNTAGLIKKLAVEVIAAEDIHNRKGRTYRVFSYASILKRRKAAGFEWVSRDKARKFIQNDGLPFADDTNTDGSDSDLDTVVSATTVVESVAIHTATVVATTTVPMVAASTGTVVATTPPLGSVLGISKEVKTTSSERSQMMQALAEYGRPDNQAVEQLWRTCREICPDAAVEEVVALIHEKGLHIVKNRGLTSPIGFLLTSVPKCFYDESIAELRRQLARKREAATAREEEELRREREYLAMLRADYEKYIAITLDPSASPDKVRSAETMLASIVPELERYDIK